MSTSKTDLEKRVKELLLEDGFEEGPFGVISANFSNGMGSMNLTLVIADIIERLNNETH